MERNLLMCLVILIICYTMHILEASYASITGNPEVVNIGENLTMSCKYNGSFTVNSIFWERNSAGLEIRLFANCVPANIPDSTVYNMNRTTYSCDQVNNIYSLTLNNLVAGDDGNSWACTLRLSAGNSTHPVVYIIRLPSSTMTTTTSSSTILIPLLIPLLVCMCAVLVIFLILFCCGCLDCCKFCRDFDNHKNSTRCHLTWYFIKSGCCSFYFCKSGRTRGKCFWGHNEGERCGGCLSCRRKCTCGWPGNCQSNEISCCGCCICLCCVQEDEDIEASIEVNKKKSGPPAFHLGKKHKVESETTRNFYPDEHRSLPPISGEIENKQEHRPLPQPPEYSDVKEKDLRGLSANYDDMQGLPNDMPTSSRLLPCLAPLQQATEEDGSFKEPKKKRRKKKKKEQLNEGEPEK